MKVRTKQRFESGDLCVAPGWYEFDGYIVDEGEPLPALSEMEYWLEAGDVFPAIRRPRRACFWKYVQGIEPRIRGARPQVATAQAE